jgi:hypothetical protein
LQREICFFALIIIVEVSEALCMAETGILKGEMTALVVVCVTFGYDDRKIVVAEQLIIGNE